MDACEEYARRWAKKEDVEVDTLTVSNPDTNYSGSGCILTHEKHLILVMQLE